MKHRLAWFARALALAIVTLFLLSTFAACKGDKGGKGMGSGSGSGRRGGGGRGEGGPSFPVEVY
ncbi:MAG: hypothetical protein JNK04_07565, partial [Myxococcales bacterium]|nr:hypothetical protein [Myxococcales bacterium]